MKPVPHNRPVYGAAEQASIRRVLRSGWLGQGPETAAFEDDFCRFLGLAKGRAVAVSSGTAALYLALWALKAEGKRVAYPAYACSALRHAVRMARGKERRVDLAAAGPNLDPLRLSGADIAIVPHLFGIPQRLRAAPGVEIIEDCAQAAGAEAGGRPVGLQGRLSIFSFFGTKLMTTGGQGGIVVSRDRALIAEIRDYREFDARDDGRARFNFQMTDVQAAIGRAQLARLPALLARRETLFQRYRRAGLPLLDASLGLAPARYRAVVLTADPDRIIGKLAARGVSARKPVDFWLLPGEKGRFPNAERMWRQAVSLPLYPSLTDGEADRVIAAWKEAHDQ